MSGDERTLGERTVTTQTDVPALIAFAHSLLGAHISARGVTIRLTEVEAYAGECDPGSHSYRGETPRNSVMFGPQGHAYVYFTYGMHHCLNLVFGPAGSAGGVLLRAGEVIEGIDTARSRRTVRSDRDLARGPARLAQCLAMTLADNGIAVAQTGAPLIVTDHGTVPVSEISSGPRVGVSGPGGDGAQYPWRFWITGDPTVSQYRPAKPRR